MIISGNSCTCFQTLNNIRGYEVVDGLLTVVIKESGHKRHWCGPCLVMKNSYLAFLGYFKAADSHIDSCNPCRQCIRCADINTVINRRHARRCGVQKPCRETRCNDCKTFISYMNNLSDADRTMISNARSIERSDS